MAWGKDVKIQKGRFTDWCKKHGFGGPTLECVRKALSVSKKSNDKSLRGMALFALRAKQGWKKTVRKP